MKRWLREWILIDLIALGLGGALLLAYIVGYPYIDPDSPQASLVPNIATEIIGVWLSVRIIDRLLRRRENFHQSRRALLGDLFLIGNHLEGFFPVSVYGNNQSMKSALSWLEDQFDNLSRYLYEDEKALANHCLSLAKYAVGYCDEILSELLEISKLNTSFQYQFVHINKQRDQIQNILNKLRFRVFNLAVEAPQSLREYAKGIEPFLQASDDFLSPTEQEFLADLYQKMNRDIEYDHITIDGLIPPENQVERIYYRNMPWYLQFEQAFELVTRNPFRTEPEWRSLLDEVAIGIDSSNSNLPKALLPQAVELRSRLAGFGEKGLGFYLLSEQYQQAVETLKHNVSVETM